MTALPDTFIFVPDFDLTGRRALVTGASRGIGQAIAQRFARGGAAVAISARTKEEGDHRLAGSLASTAAAIRASGGKVESFVADLAKPEQRQRLIDEVQAKLGSIDVLVNNAAVTYFEPVSECPEKHFELMFAVQVRAPVIAGAAPSSGRTARRAKCWDGVLLRLRVGDP